MFMPKIEIHVGVVAVNHLVSACLYLIVVNMNIDLICSVQDDLGLTIRLCVMPSGVDFRIISKIAITKIIKLYSTIASILSIRGTIYLHEQY